jgi:hypothetical protein
MIKQNAEYDWTPSAELLAAYADGELDEEGPQAALCRRIESWLARNPEMARTLDAHRRITEWCRDTAAEDPGPVAWASVMGRLRLAVGSGQGRRWTSLPWLAAAGGTAAACLVVAVTLVSWLGKRDTAYPHNLMSLAQPQPRALREDAEPDVLPVATASEVEVLSVKGEDTTTLVVGELPVEGPLPLLQTNEVTFTRIEPARDNMVPEVRRAGHTTFVWAPLDAEREDLEEPNWE